ncbi:MAG: DUF2948 family protein [Alphaproteobacteria bacterium]
MTDNKNYTPLLLKALDGQDLAIIAGLVQDSILQLSDTKYDKKGNEFVCVLNRFAWEVNTDKSPYIRTHCALVFNDVKKVSSQGIDMKQDRMYSLLSAIPSSDNDGINIFLSFSGGGVMRLSVDKINVVLKDVGDYWETENRPHHENNEINK